MIIDIFTNMNIIFLMVFFIRYKIKNKITRYVSICINIGQFFLSKNLTKFAFSGKRNLKKISSVKDCWSHTLE